MKITPFEVGLTAALLVAVTVFLGIIFCLLHFVQKFW